MVQSQFRSSQSRIYKNTHTHVRTPAFIGAFSVVFSTLSVSKRITFHGQRSRSIYYPSPGSESTEGYANHECFSSASTEAHLYHSVSVSCSLSLPPANLPPPPASTPPPLRSSTPQPSVCGCLLQQGDRFHLREEEAAGQRDKRLVTNGNAEKSVRPLYFVPRSRPSK